MKSLNHFIDILFAEYEIIYNQEGVFLYNCDKECHLSRVYITDFEPSMDIDVEGCNAVIYGECA